MLIICILPGTYFFMQYFRPDIRVVASNWLIANLPPKSLVLSEGGNIINLPVGDNQLTVDNYDFYKYDPLSLAASLNISDYVMVPSRRVFANYHYSYYTHLFNGTLGFTEIKSFTSSTDLLLNPEIAEETWSVFDRPTIRIYKKVSQLSLSQYENLVK